MNGNIFILLLMLFLHIFDDYYLQGRLSDMKQKSWWRAQTNNTLYEYDYIWALIVHAFSWTFMVTMPIMFMLRFELNSEFLIVFSINVIIHAIVDHLKANKKVINLWHDQIIHIFQIIWLFAEFVLN